MIATVLIGITTGFLFLVRISFLVPSISAGRHESLLLSDQETRDWAAGVFSRLIDDKLLREQG